GPFVSSKPAGKSDGQHIRTEHAAKSLQRFVRLASALPLSHCAASHKFEKLQFQAQMRLPELGIVEAFNSLPDSDVTRALAPTGAEMAVVETGHLRRQPGRHMHAICNVSDGDHVLGLAGIQRCPHRSAEPAV